MKSISAPTFLRALLIAGLSCFGSTSVHAAGTEAATPAYATIQPNVAGTGYVYTISYVAGEDWVSGAPRSFEGGPFGNGGAALDNVTNLQGGDWFEGAQKVLYRSTNASTAGLHTKDVNTVPNTTTAVNWADPLTATNTAVGFQGPTNATPQYNDMGTWTLHDSLIFGSGIQGVTGVFNANSPTAAGATVGLGVGIQTDLDAGGFDDLGFMVVGYNDSSLTVKTNPVPRKGYVQVVVPYPTAQETATVGAGVLQVETLPLSGNANGAGTAQVETATIAGTITASGAGNALITVTGSLIVGSPLAVNVAVANNDTAATVAGKVRTALLAVAAITNFYTVGGSSATVSLTKKTPFTANDTSLNIAFANDTCVGLTANTTSANTTAGVSAGAGTMTITVTAAGMTNSPKVVNVAIANSANTTSQATSAVTALNADADVGAFFVATSSTNNIILTAKEPAANDATMNVASAPGTATGPVAVPTSADTTAGYAIGAGDVSVTVTGTLITGSPLVVPVALLATDTSAEAATKIVAALAALPAITNSYSVSVSSATGVRLTKTAAPIDTWDTTLNIAIADGTTTGVTAAPASSPVGGAFEARFIPGVYTNNPVIELTVSTDPNYVPKIAVSGDFNSDLAVNATDLTAAAAGYEGADDIVPLKWYRNGDINADSDVDNADLGYIIGAYTPSTSSGSATLTYDPLTGNVKLNAATAAGAKITSFQLQTSAATIVTANYTPVTGGTFNGTYKNVTTNAIGDTDTGLTGISGSSIDLGNVFPTGMDLPTLTAYLTTRVYTGGSGSGQQNLTLALASAAALDHFAISAIASPQTEGTPITGITITAQDATNATFTGFTGTVTFGGTAGVTGTSASFVNGELSSVSVTPTASGSNLTLTVDDGASHTGTTTITTVQTRYAAWSGGSAANIDTNGDGVDNGVAWALNAANVNDNAIGLLPALDNTSDPTYVIFAFNRSDNAQADSSTAISVQYGSDLDTWITAVDDNDNVEIEITPGTPTDAVLVKLKRSTLGASGKIFARLNVAVTP